jgi:hypothetical protein
MLFPTENQSLCIGIANQQFVRTFPDQQSDMYTDFSQQMLVGNVVLWCSERTLVEMIRVKNGVFLANEKQGNFFKRNLLGSNHLLQQTKLNKTEN